MTVPPPRLHRSSSPLRRPPAGFTLIEILVVIMLIALLASAAGFGVIQQAGHARTRVARISARDIRNVARLYIADHPGACPDVETLVADGLLDDEEAHVDPWEEPFEIRCGSPLLVISAGPDRVAGTDDDVVAGPGSDRASRD